jgi:hypothetical protein
MKKIISILFAVTLLFSACSKDQRINKQLDGDWTVTKENGVPVTDPTTYSFAKDKKGAGTFTFTSVSTYGTDSYSGTYQISDEKITMTVSTILGSFSFTASITEHSKTTFKISTAGGETEMTKK